VRRIALTLAAIRVRGAREARVGTGATAGEYRTRATNVEPNGGEGTSERAA